MRLAVTHHVLVLLLLCLLFAAETVAVGIVDFEFDVSNGIVAIECSATIAADSIKQPTDIVFASFGNPISSQRIQPIEGDVTVLQPTATAAASKVVKLILSKQFLNQLKDAYPFAQSITHTFLRIGSNFILGSSGTNGHFIQTSNLVADRIPPEIFQIDLTESNGEKVLIIRASEPLGQLPQIALTFASYSFNVPTKRLFHSFTANFVLAELLLVNDATIWELFEETLHSSPGVDVIVQMSNVQDVFGNAVPILLKFTPSSVYVDTIAPTITHLDIDFETRRLRMYFSESITLVNTSAIEISSLSLHSLNLTLVSSSPEKDEYSFASDAFFWYNLQYLLGMNSNPVFQVQEGFAADAFNNRMLKATVSPVWIPETTKFKISSASFDFNSSLLTFSSSTMLHRSALAETNLVLRNGKAVLYLTAFEAISQLFPDHPLPFTFGIPASKADILQLVFPNGAVYLDTQTLRNIFNQTAVLGVIPIALLNKRFPPTISSVELIQNVSLDIPYLQVLITLSEPVSATDGTVSMRIATEFVKLPLSRHESNVYAGILTYQESPSLRNLLRNSTLITLQLAPGWCSDPFNNTVGNFSQATDISQFDFQGPRVVAASILSSENLLVVEFSELIVLSFRNFYEFKLDSTSVKFPFTSVNSFENILSVDVTSHSELLQNVSNLTFEGFVSDAMWNPMQPFQIDIQTVRLSTFKLDFVSFNILDSLLYCRFSSPISPRGVRLDELELAVEVEGRSVLFFVTLRHAQVSQGVLIDEVIITLDSNSVQLLSRISSNWLDAESLFLVIDKTSFFGKSGLPVSSFPRERPYNIQSIVNKNSSIVPTSRMPEPNFFRGYPDDKDDFKWTDTPWIIAGLLLLCLIAIVCLVRIARIYSTQPVRRKEEFPLHPEENRKVIEELTEALPPRKRTDALDISWDNTLDPIPLQHMTEDKHETTRQDTGIVVDNIPGVEDDEDGVDAKEYNSSEGSIDLRERSKTFDTIDLERLRRAYIEVTQSPRPASQVSHRPSEAELERSISSTTIRIIGELMHTDVPFAQLLRKKLTALYDYEAQNDDEVSFLANEELVIYDIGEGEDWITVKTSTGAIGLAPKLYIAKSAGLEPLKPPPLILPSRSISLEDEVRNDVIMEQSADNPLESHISLPAPPYPTVRYNGPLRQSTIQD